jgi:hypothetical protein
MPANTAKGYPYPLGTDRLMDGDDAIHSLATAVDTKSGVSTSGTVNVNVTTGGTPASVAVTFPAGLFSAVPNVITTCISGAPQNTPSGASSVSATGATIWGSRNSAGSQPVAYFAVQV